jgi:hypothetical protein
MSEDDHKNFEEANIVFMACILSILVDRMCDVFMHIKDGNELWDALDVKFGTSHAGSKLYIMEIHDFKMTKDLPVIQQAREIHCIAKELELLKYALPDKFVAGCIISKLSPPRRNFTTALKHKREEISVENMIVSLDVEEKARAKDTTEKGEGYASANFVQKSKPSGKNKGNFKPSFNKPAKTTTFKKKKLNRDGSDLTYFTCGEPDHFSMDCPDHADRRGKKAKSVNAVTASNTDGYGNLFIVLSVFQSPCWWIDTGANVHVCADISMFTSYQAARDSSVLMSNGSHASVHVVGTVDLKFTSGKVV